MSTTVQMSSFHSLKPLQQGEPQSCQKARSARVPYWCINTSLLPCFTKCKCQVLQCLIFLCHQGRIRWCWGYGRVAIIYGDSPAEPTNDSVSFCHSGWVPGRQYHLNRMPPCPVCLRVSLQLNPRCHDLVERCWLLVVRPAYAVHMQRIKPILPPEPGRNLDVADNFFSA